MSLVTVQMYDYELLDLLLERCNYWGITKDNKDLFEKTGMIQNIIQNYTNVLMKLNIAMQYK